MHGTHFTVSQELQDELIDDIHTMLQQAQTMGAQIGQQMVDTQDRAISVPASARNLLQRAKDIVSGIIDHVRDSIGKALGKEQPEDEPLNQSEIVDQTMNDLIDQLPDLVAETEVHAEMERSVLDTMQQAGVQKMQWVAEDDACDECATLAESDPVDVEDGEWEGGVSGPPLHPRCRCNVVPA